MPSNQYGARGGFSHYQGGGGGFGNAPMQSQGLQGGYGSFAPEPSRSMDVKFGGSFNGPSFLGANLVDMQQLQQLAHQSEPVTRAGFYGRDAYTQGEG